MKPSKLTRPNLPPRVRGSQGGSNQESHGQAVTASPTRSSVISPTEDHQGSDPSPGKRKNDLLSSAKSAGISTQIATVLSQDPQGVETMRRKMSEALLRKQGEAAARKSPETTSPAASTISPLPKSASTTSAGPTPTDSSLSLSETMSSDSTKTVRATFDAVPEVMRTPSYPFPRMQAHRLQRGLSARSGPHHRPFTMLSPTTEAPHLIGSTPGGYTDQSGMSEMSTPMPYGNAGSSTPEDPDHPTPDHYDIILMLNTEPGLDAWWANVTDVLAEAYGAERASLALPGDTTDLENVPWGQKAIFNVNGSKSSGSSLLDTSVLSETDNLSQDRGSVTNTPAAEHGPLIRPPLATRHSIAGALPERTAAGSRGRPAPPIRAISTVIETTHNPQEVLTPSLISSAPRSQFGVLAAHERPPRDIASATTQGPKCHVYRNLQRLEADPDPLLVRNGVATLFGKRKPVVLTRAYSDTGSNSSSKNGSINQKSASAKSAPRARTSFSVEKAFEDYEQPEPTPWSQSPSPSPAARPDPSESPFFATTSKIDEDAFQQDAPSYDYGATANQALNAIGVDSTKTLVHIPLIQPVPSKKALASSLRFPVAILSFLSPVTPYPRNLRHSLEFLLPHFASTFSQAQSFSHITDRLYGSKALRGETFGLAGTFSDEGSELELVAELSVQMSQDRFRSKASSHASSSFGQSDRGSLPRQSPPGSLVSTPFLESGTRDSGVPVTPGQSGLGTSEGYFSVKRNRSGNLAQIKTTVSNTPGVKSSLYDSSPEQTRRTDKMASVPTSAHRKQAFSIDTTRVQRDQSQFGSPRTISATSNNSQDTLYHSAQERMENSKRMMHRDSLRPEDEDRELPQNIATLVLNAVPLQLFIAKPNTGDLVWTNTKFDAFRSQGDGRVRDPWKNVHSEDRASLLAAWKEALKSGSQFSETLRIKRFNSDSDYRWFVFRASTMLSNSGRLLYWLGSFMDVHESHMRDLEASQLQTTMERDNKIRAMADAIPQILFEAIEGQGVVGVNRQWQIYSGQADEEAKGLGFARHVHIDDMHKCGVLTATSIAQQGGMRTEKDSNGRVSYSTEVRLRSKQGDFRWFLIRLSKFQPQVGPLSAIVWYGSCTDIEDRMQLERDLNAANKKVHSEMESKTKFFANMSHEIRTPLNGILGSMPWLVEWQLDHDQRRTLDMIQNSANNLRELVDNILDVTKVEAGKMTLVPKWFSVRSLCEEVIDTCSSRAIERGLELNYSLDTEMPTLVKGDPFRIRQVLLNLMGNSVKFTQEGEAYLRCMMRPQSEAALVSQAYLCFDVVDTGRGFNEDEFKRLFKQFGQIEGASQHDAGSGLGLFLSKQLVEMHGGQLSVSSKVGEGSTFSFYISVEIDTSATETVKLEQNLPLRPSTRQSVSFESNVGKSGNATPITVTAAKTMVESPSIISPPATSSSSGHSAGIPGDSASSNLPTPDSTFHTRLSQSSISAQDRTRPASRKSSYPTLSRAQSDSMGARLDPVAHPQIYSVVVICPAEHARHAITQHIQHVVPHDIPINVISLTSIGDLLQMRQSTTPPVFTHIVLAIPASSDIMLFMRQMSSFTIPLMPVLVIVTDLYQKKDIAEDFLQFNTEGRRAFMIHKPVKPSIFAAIFDPSQLRKLSKDPSREVVQSGQDDFKNIATLVKDTIGNKGFRLLLVEDSDTNRMVIQRYLKRVGLLCDEARDGQECVNAVRAHPSGYYSLIICDIQMPKKNGYEACIEVRQHERENAHPGVPIMALTANAMPEERAAAGQAGFTDYLTKPVDFSKLGRMMIALLATGKVEA